MLRRVLRRSDCKVACRSTPTSQRGSEFRVQRALDAKASTSERNVVGVHCAVLMCTCMQGGGEQRHKVQGRALPTLLAGPDDPEQNKQCSSSAAAVQQQRSSAAVQQCSSSAAQQTVVTCLIKLEQAVGLAVVGPRGVVPREGRLWL